MLTDELKQIETSRRENKLLFETGAESLNEAVELRKEMLETLRFAPPDQTAKIRRKIAALDKLIERIEQSLEQILETFKRIDKIEQKCLDFNSSIQEKTNDFLDQIAREFPDQIEIAKALLEKSGESH